MSTLPDSILDAVELSPIEDLVLHVLRTKYPDMAIGTLIADDQQFPFVLIRRDGGWGEWQGDPRFTDAGHLTVHTFAAGIEADTDAALLAEAVRIALRDAVNLVVAGRHLTKARMISSPTRKTDWATATGPVQYADLPTGVVRYETVFSLEMRKPATKPYAD